MIREARGSDCASVAALIERGFSAQIASSYSEAGRVGFRMYVQEHAIRSRLAGGALALVAELQGSGIVGYLEMRGRGELSNLRGRDHITLLFVDLLFQGQGLSRSLLDHTIALVRSEQPDVSDLTIHASPHARPIYQRLGFKAESEPFDKGGIIATPMRLRL